MKAAEPKSSRMQSQSRTEGLETLWRAVGSNLHWKSEETGDSCPKAMAAKDAPTGENWSFSKMGELLSFASRIQTC